jgi:DNA (cytosine-5)-methyltransferase 1
MDSAGFCGKPDKGRKGPNSGRTLTGKVLEIDGRGPHAKTRSFPTPRASEWKGCGPLGSKSHNHRLKKKYLDATVQDVEQRTGQLNPDWVECLMGWPPGWTDPSPLDREVFDFWLEHVGHWWAPEVWNYLESILPRLTDVKENRVNRLKAIGNGQVSLCMATAKELLK